MTKQTKTQLIAAQVAQILETTHIKVLDTTVTPVRNAKGHYAGTKLEVKLTGRGLNTPFKRHYHRKTRFPKLIEAGLQPSFVEKTRGADFVVVEVLAA